MKEFLLTLLALMATAMSYARELNINPELLKHRWPARWISHPEAPRQAYGVFHFRKSFELDTKPTSFVIHVSADNRYRLFVNGVFVCSGPARGDLAHWRFETLDIAPHLRTGKNVLAAVVWNFGEWIPWAQMTQETGFILQGNGESEAVVNTDEQWKVLQNKAYQPIPLDWQKIRHFIVVGPGDQVEASLYPWGWEQTDYDDSLWPRAKVISSGTPRQMRDGSSHWMLVPRIIPFMEEKLQRIPRIVRSSGGTVEARFLKGEKDWVVPAGTRITVLLDQTYLTTAYPELLVSGGKGAVVTLTYAESLYDKDGHKGNRNETEGKEILGYYDRFIADGGSKRLFRPLWFRTFRYLQMEIETQKEPLIIHDFKGIYTGYPFQEKASFTCNDPSLKQIWEVGWRTARLCAGETYFDCPYYEQLQYVGDTRIQALISLYVSGDDRLMRKAILQFDDSRIPDGLTASRYPSWVPQIIPPYSLFWIAMIHDYWRHRDDPEFVKSFLPGIRTVLEWFERHLDDTGMLGPLPWWNFVDWAREYQHGVPSGAEEGGSSIISLQFVYALQYAEELALAFGRNEEARHYQELAQKVISATRQQCWDSQKGLLADDREKSRFSQHANVMAILVGMIPENDLAPFAERVATDTSLIQCTFYYRYYLLRALKQAGLADRYIEMLQPWRDMLKIGLTTFAEAPEPTRSDCHAWSASPNYEFLATVCGIEPAEPGFKKVNIRPYLGPLKWVEANMPHPLGEIKLHLKRKGKSGIKGFIILPEGLEGTFFWDSQVLALRPGRQEVAF
ncbi:MAG: glycoside hydrolase family 78 protein [candidate division KSB1 bacterium]|nr:glycoside hydrolase family 78 protein [candidate division KSB1 bacterium]